MRWRSKPGVVALLCGAALIGAIPAIGQENPKSILPPGFGEEEPAAPPADQIPNKPTDLLPDLKLETRTETGGARTSPSALPSAIDPLTGETLPLDPTAEAAALAAQQPGVLQDLPPSARRSTAVIGIIDAQSGGFEQSAFGASNGAYLAALMRNMRAPLASRWSSILLRRALLSRVDTPAGISGADWAAERAWLLLRMGEAEPAQLIVQSVDVDQYTPKMFEVAMQSGLANADPAGLCPMVEPAMKVSDERAWPAARAICSALSGESAQASAQIDGVRRKGPGRGIDGLLAEKVVGAGGNTRRAVVIEWDTADRLTAWRYGMATATGLQIPERLMATVGPNVRAWAARAPLLPLADRSANAEVAAALGVFSSAALVDHFSAVADATDPADRQGKSFTLLRAAYVGEDTAARVAAMRSLWTVPAGDAHSEYARLILTARAAGGVAPDDGAIGTVDKLVESMLAAGLDVQAARWAKLIEDDSNDPAVRAWGLLAVGSPGQVVDWRVGSIRNYLSKAGVDHPSRGQFLVAAMAGLGRIDGANAASLADDLGIPIATQTRWTRALERAVVAREPATVALLCAVGLQGRTWKAVSPAHLYHVVSALRRVGLAGEARMIAAEALTRS